ncbi:MAG: hypothetical protein KDB07_02525, partial [Planctomycetes bacterium]|nr:hypothetical protein [Planctomycetota bacterium]
EEMEADRERLEVKAPAAGTVIFGDLSDAKSFDGGIKQGAGVKLRQTLFTVADMNTMRAEISVPVAQRASLLENGAGKVNDLDAKVTGVGLIANGKSVRAMIEIDANGRLLIGQEVTFKR